MHPQAVVALSIRPPPSHLYDRSGFPNGGVNATGRTFMRGALITKPNGKVTFRTIVPGWYSGRLAHIHMRVRDAPGPPTARAFRRNTGFTTQLYLPDRLLRSVYAAAPYQSARGYTATVASDFELKGNWPKYQALTAAVRPATRRWLRANGFAKPGDRWGLGHVASYTLRLRW